MEKEKYTLTLTGEGKTLTVKNLTLNGNNYVSERKVNFSTLPAVFAMTATDSQGNIVEQHDSAKLLQQEKYDWDGGKYYLAFSPLSQMEVEKSEQDSRIEYIAMMADVELEGAE